MGGHRTETAVWDMVESSGRDGAGGESIGGDSRYQSVGDAGEKANRLYWQDRIGIRCRDLRSTVTWPRVF